MSPYERWLEDFKAFKEGKELPRLTMGEIWETEARAQKEIENRCIENAKLDAKAVWVLADYCIPADVRESAERWKMNETLIEMWRGAFIQGWRAANRK